MPDLNHRARKILSAVVSEYLTTGEAVGSRTVTRRYGVELSAATVRNVMADLEEAGLLKQPHTSAGRVPTDLGLRFFVDSLLKVRSLSPKERDELRARYNSSTGELDSALRESSKVLSDLSQHTVVLLMPRVNQDVLEHIEFMRLPSGALLAVLVTKSGQVQNRLLHPATPLSGDELERIHNYLHERLSGLTLSEVRRRIAQELASERVQYSELEKKALEMSRAVLPREDVSEVIIEGSSRLIEQTMQGEVDVEKMRHLLHALEEKQRLIELLEQTEQAQGLKVFIGNEAQLGDVSDLSMVATPYGSEERTLGTLGVIGPTRMNYSRIIALVDFTSHVLSNLLAGR